MQIRFTKMHGLGNDFVIIDAVNQSLSLTNKEIIFLCHRRFGIGCDQLFLVRQSEHADADFSCVIFNSDGSNAKHCGNGMRCLARFLQAHKLSDKKNITPEVAGNIIDTIINDDDTVSVDMGKPIFTPDKVPFISEVEKPNYQVAGYTLGVLSMGNPHALLCVDDMVEMSDVDEIADLADVDVKGIGEAIQKSALFPESVNVGFAQVLRPNEIKLRVFERGAGETLACGSGACAAVAYLVHVGKLTHSVITVRLSGGALNITYNQGGSVLMRGAAEFVFDGKVTI